MATARQRVGRSVRAADPRPVSRVQPAEQASAARRVFRRLHPLDTDAKPPLKAK